ncbi:hypothetical protein BHE74_00052541 [Ensete ventricosum]|nr:hypothetical protein BHE74_00052541 [Ensete ventricosum]
MHRDSSNPLITPPLVAICSTPPIADHYLVQLFLLLLFLPPSSSPFSPPPNQQMVSWYITRFAISICTARYERYIPVRQVTGMRTTRYRVVPSKIDRRRPIEGEINSRRSISAVGGRLREKSGLNLDCNFAVNLPAAASTAASSSLKSKTAKSLCDEPLITGPRCTPTDRPSEARKPQKLSSLVDLSGVESELIKSVEEQRELLNERAVAL